MFCGIETFTWTALPTALRTSGADSVMHLSTRYDEETSLHPASPPSQKSSTRILDVSALKPRPSTRSSTPPPGVPSPTDSDSPRAMASGVERATLVTSMPARTLPGLAKPALLMKSSASACPASHSGMRQRCVLAS